MGEKLRMCNNRQKIQDQGLPDWQRLYQDLSALFNEQNHNTTNTRPSIFSILLGLLGIDTSSYNSPTQVNGLFLLNFQGQHQDQHVAQAVIISLRDAKPNVAAVMDTMSQKS